MLLPAGVLTTLSTFLPHPLPFLQTCRTFYAQRHLPLYYPLPHPLPPFVASNYEFVKRKTRCQTHCFVCDGVLSTDRFCYNLCPCLGFYPKCHIRCSQRRSKLCMICRSKTIYFELPTTSL